MTRMDKYLCKLAIHLETPQTEIQLKTFVLINFIEKTLSAIRQYLQYLTTAYCSHSIIDTYIHKLYTNVK